MGLSASQARLLSITARLSANEYESQQISNAKMRLATQSEQASQEYIAALNATQMNFLSYDAQGDAQSTNLTANVLFQYSDMKNQYAIVNSSGQLLLPANDIENFKKSNNLDEFLACYGITKTFKNEEIADSYAILTNKKNQNVYNNWESLVTKVRQGKHDVENVATEVVYFSELEGPVGYSQLEFYRRIVRTRDDGLTAEQAYMYESYGAYIEYNDVSINYKSAVMANDPTIELIEYQSALDDLSQKIADCSTFETWCNGKARDKAENMYVDKNGNIADESVAVTKNEDGTYTVNEDYQTLKDAVDDYFAELEKFQFLAEDAGYTTLPELYTYSDPTMAQWYTNLWYRLNGDSSNKTAVGNSGATYAQLDDKLASSSDWLQDSLRQGLVSLELATNQDVNDVLENDISTLTDSLNVKLKGITWTSKLYTTASDFTETNNDAAIAKASAEYERKTHEISVKDQKYQNKIKLLDTEHTALQAQYDSIKSAIGENVKRSFTSFSG